MSWPGLADVKIRLPILFLGHDSSLRTEPRSNIICCPEFETTSQFPIDPRSSANPNCQVLVGL
jgi:hypothetical protein